MNIEIIINSVLEYWIYICIWFSIFAFVFGIVFFSISFLIWAILELEGKIRTEKVWRIALREYFEKRKIGYMMSDKDLNIESRDE